MGILGTRSHYTYPKIGTLIQKCVIDTTFGSHAYAICTDPGSIYTVDEEDSTTDCMLIENGKILAMGNNGMPNITPSVCLI